VCEEGAQAGGEQQREDPKVDIFGSHGGIIDDALELLAALLFFARG
jgi:hypothetical protein